MLTKTGGGGDPGDPAPPTCGPLLSKNKSATSSSIEHASLGPQYTVDGNTGPAGPAHDRFGDGGIDDLAVTGTARYVRMNGLARGTPYGHSLWEMEVFGACPGGGDPGPGDPDPPGATTWAPGVSYAVGQKVLYNGVGYACRQAHTSIATWEPPNAPALWLAS
jgi:hypothetical protein